MKDSAWSYKSVIETYEENLKPECTRILASCCLIGCCGHHKVSFLHHLFGMPAAARLHRLPETRPSNWGALHVVPLQTSVGVVMYVCICVAGCRIFCKTSRPAS